MLLLFLQLTPEHGSELWSVEVEPAASGFTWTGNVSTEWENAGNWSGNQAPVATSAVYIPPGRPRYPGVSVTNTVKSIHCKTGSSVIIAEGVVLNALQ